MTADSPERLRPLAIGRWPSEVELQFNWPKADGQRPTAEAVPNPLLYWSRAMTSEAKPEQFLYLTTLGRKSGEPRIIEIWFIEFRGCWYCIAEHTTSNWLRNLRANPAVRWRVGKREFRGTARVLDPKSYEAMMVEQLSRTKYGWGEGTVVELRPGS